LISIEQTFKNTHLLSKGRYF